MTGNLLKPLSDVEVGTTAIHFSAVLKVREKYVKL